MDNKENMNTGANAEQGQTEAAGTDKTFTQEEVNRIVQERLARSKGKDNSNSEENQSKDKEKELQAREMRILAREKLLDAGIKNDCLELLNGATDEKDLDNRIKIIMELTKSKENKEEPQKSGFIAIGAPGDQQGEKADPIKKAMGLI